MHPRIFREFRVESCGHGSSLPDRDRIRTLGSQYFDPFAYIGDFGSADEDHFERQFAESSFVRIARAAAHDELTFADRAVDLTPVRVAPDADIERSKSGLLRVFHFARQQDGSSARPEGGLRLHKLS